MGAAPTERWLQLIGNIVQIAPDVAKIPDWEELVRNYGIAIGVQSNNMKTREAVDEERQAELEKQQADEMAASVVPAATGAKLLSETDVGGGANALQNLLAAS